MTAPDPSRAHIAAVVREVVTSILPGVDPRLITGEKNLKELGADSVDRVEIILSLIDRLGLLEPMSRFNDLPHIDALVDLLAGSSR